MRCPICAGDTRVIDSRPRPEGLRRRRSCVCCAHRFTTREYIVEKRRKRFVRIALRGGGAR